MNIYRSKHVVRLIKGLIALLHETSEEEELKAIRPELIKLHKTINELKRGLHSSERCKS